MKKIKFAIASTFIIVFAIAIFSFAAEVKNTLPTTSAAPAAPAATSKQIQQPPVPPAAHVAPAVAPTQVQQPPPPAPTSIDNYSYNPSGKPDPFKPFIVVDRYCCETASCKKSRNFYVPVTKG